MNISRFVAVLSAAFFAALAGSAWAQAFPSKTVKLTSAYASGTGPELTARLIADKLSRMWGQSVIVEARPGGSGVIAIEAVKKAAADGHEMLVAGGGHLVISPITNRSLPYDTERDFAPVAINFQSPFFVAVSANGPYRTMGDIVAAAKSNPGKVAAGTQYLGSSQHLAAVMIELMSRTQMLHVPFKENSQLFASLINGDIGWTLATQASADPFVKSGRVKFISHTAKSRLPSHPDLPTMEEGGVGAMDSSAWAGIFVPRATPAERVSMINRDMMKAMAEPDFQQRIATMGLVLLPHTPADFARLIRGDFELYGEAVRRGNIKLQ